MRNVLSLVVIVDAKCSIHSSDSSRKKKKTEKCLYNNNQRFMKMENGRSKHYRQNNNSL